MIVKSAAELFSKKYLHIDLEVIPYDVDDNDNQNHKRHEMSSFMSKEYKPLPMIKSSRFIKLFDSCNEKTRQDVIV